jgi:hypothetical protein
MNLGQKAGSRHKQTLRDNDNVTILEVMRLMPVERGWLLGHLLDGPIRVVIAVRSGENDDAEFHAGSLPKRL